MTQAPEQTWTVGGLLQWTERFFAGKGVESPRLDAQILLAHALGCKRIDLYARSTEAAPEAERVKFRDLVRKADAIDAEFVATFAPPRDRIFVAELARITRPGGTLVVNTPHLKNSWLRRVRHAIETSRAFARWNRIDDALTALLDAEQVGPDQVRYHRLSRMIVREVLARPRPPRLAIELSGRMGVGSGLPKW